jgi:hypothetical protein
MKANHSVPTTTLPDCNELPDNCSHRTNERKTKLAEPANRHVFTDHANQTQDITHNKFTHKKMQRKNKTQVAGPRQLS